MRVFPYFTAVLLVAVLSPVPANASLMDMFVFGDSISDTGNASQLTGGLIPPFPPYPPAGTDGTTVFSSGPVWPTQLAQALGLADPNNVNPLEPVLAAGINNFAIGGANTDFTNTFGPSGGLLDQIALFEQIVMQPNAAPLPDEAWFVIAAGSNDLLFSSNPVETAPQAVDNIILAMETLEEKGAAHFLVFNLSDLGQTPFAGFPENVPNLVAAALTDGTNLFNSELVTDLLAFQTENPLVDVAVLDINTFFAEIVLDPAAFGFTGEDIPGVPDGIGPCFNQAAMPPAPPLCPPEAWNSFVYFDLVHPSSRTHGLIAQAVLTAKIPEPSTILLLALGVAGLGVLHGRRRILT